MRFPNTLPMWRTFDLFRRLEFTGHYISDEEKLEEIACGKAPYGFHAPGDSVDADEDEDAINPGNQAGNTLDVIPYRMSTRADVQYFNDIQYNKAAISANGSNPTKRVDLFDVSRSNRGPVPDDYVRQGVQYWIDAKIGFFKKELKEDFKKGKDLLMNYDEFSTRQFMQTLHPELARPFRKYMASEYPERPLECERAYPNEVRHHFFALDLHSNVSPGGQLARDLGLRDRYGELDFNADS